MDTSVYNFRSTGRIVYDPKRGGMKRRTKWWCVLNVDREITRYYRWWVSRRFWGMTAMKDDWLCQPSWDAHVSIIRGETPRREFRSLWGKYQGEEVEFWYSHNACLAGDRGTRYAEDGDFWFVDVYCPRIDEIRDELGLKTFYKYHLTVGRTYDGR